MLKYFFGLLSYLTQDTFCLSYKKCFFSNSHNNTAFLRFLIQFLSIYDITTPSGPWPPLKDAFIFLCLMLVSSIFVFLGYVMCPSAHGRPISFLVFPLVFYYEISH